MKEPLTLADIYVQRGISVSKGRHYAYLKDVIRKVIPVSTICLYYDPYLCDRLFSNIDNMSEFELKMFLCKDLYWFKIGEIYIFWNRYTHAKLHNTNIRNWLQLLSRNKK